MPALSHPRRVATLLLALAAVGAALVAFGSAPALAYTPIYGSGAALQSQLQNDILIPDSGLSGDVTFTATTSGKGFEELGDENGVLKPALDTTAGKLTPPELDAFTATDSGPSPGQLSNAQAAAGSTATNEIAVPVAQTPLDLLLSLPAGVTLNAAQNVDLTAPLAGELYAGTTPAAGGYPENTWGALLRNAGLTAITTGSPEADQFLDTGSPGSPGTGGYTPIELEVRKNGAGTTLNLKQYLPLVDPTDWTSIPVDENVYGTNELPAGAIVKDPSPGNSTDANEVEAVDKSPGTIGYATAGDTSETTPTKFTPLPLSRTDYGSGSHQILYALLQDNYVAGSRTAPVYADPEANGTGTANVYSGANVQVNSSTSGGAGSWVVPSAAGGSTFDPDGTWSGTRASDPDIYDDSGDDIAYYPLVAVAFDLSWSNFSVGKLASEANYSSAAQATTQAFLEFATSPTGQGDITGNYYYAPLPSDPGNTGLANIQAVAHAAAAGV
jgi:hypothetical protein